MDCLPISHSICVDFLLRSGFCIFEKELYYSPPSALSINKNVLKLVYTIIHGKVQMMQTPCSLSTCSY